MPAEPLILSPNYLTVVRGIREMHRLIAAGQADSPAAEALRDATDRPWQALTEVERKRASGLSEDLYSITEGPPPAWDMNPQAAARLNHAFEARQRGEWDRALELLRKWGAHVAPALVSYLRGSIWIEAGDPHTAVLFYEHASRLQPDNGNYLAIFLHTLGIVDPVAAGRRGEEILREPERFPAVAVVRAADVEFKAARALPEVDATQLFRQLIPVLQGALARIEAGDESGVDRSSYAMAAALLGFSHEFLGETQPALDFYSRGLAAQPHNDGLLVARGILLYGSGPRAIHDLEAAARQGSPVIWPYFFLAHHYLVNGDFDRCRILCERAMEMAGSGAAKSELAEWLAISQSELGFPVEMVRASFENSIRLDPSNGRARRNLAAFEAASRPVPARVYETRSAAAVRASGLAERRYAMAA
jgi:tetratricopeptide (TPR) repeat protein